MKKEQIEKANAILEKIDILKKDLEPLQIWVNRNDQTSVSLLVKIQYQDNNGWKDKAYAHPLFDKVFSAMIDDIQTRIKQLEMELELL